MWTLSDIPNPESDYIFRVLLPFSESSPHGMVSGSCLFTYFLQGVPTSQWKLRHLLLYVIQKLFLTINDSVL